MNDQTGNRRLRDVLNISPDGRRIHHWIGRDRTRDIAALVEAIASTGELFNHNGTLVRLDGNGKIVGVNLAGLQEFIAGHICGVRVIVHDGVANKEYFSYGFDVPRPARPTIATGLHGGESRTSGPDQAALDQIYRRDLLEILPRVEAGA